MNWLVYSTSIILQKPLTDLLLTLEYLSGATIIRHILNVEDRKTVVQIMENMYLYYFLGYSSYIMEPPFGASLFVNIKKRLGQELIAEMNEKIHGFSRKGGKEEQRG